MSRSAVTIARLFLPNDSSSSDRLLLRAFVLSDGEAAFEELVRRHGPMVLAACRRVLGNAHDADDAFQAVFLVLARKAGTIRGNLAGWLYAVAVRTARGVRIMRDRRRKHEQLAVASGRGGSAAPTCLPDHDLAEVIDEELARLPEQYREPLVLCELRGLSRKEAAAELGIPEGTLSSRLAAGKRKLGALLAARGLAAPALLVPLLAPAPLSAALVRSATSIAQGTVGPVAMAAANAVVKGMLFQQLKSVALACGIMLTAVCGGLAMTGASGGSDPAPAPVPHIASDPAAVKLVEQLGAAEFADRETAHEALRKIGMKAEAALRTGLRSETPEVRVRAAKLLNEIRADARIELVKNFDPAKEDQPDHPLWKRFKSIAGDTKASRELFALIIKNRNSLQRLDAVEANPAIAGQQYREAIEEVGRRYRSNLSIRFRIPVWPCDLGEEVAYFLFLGSYSHTAPDLTKLTNSEARLFVEGEGRIPLARGLELGLQGNILKTGPKLDPDLVKAVAGTDLVFARLLVSWLPNRTDPDTLWGGFRLAALYGTEDVLPFARLAAADRSLPVAARCYALMPIAQFGTLADLPLFEALFADETVIAVHLAPDFRSVAPPGAKPIPPIGNVQARDFAAAHALMLFGENPADHGFVQAAKKLGKRPEVAQYLITEFAFPIDDGDRARSAAHANVKAFLKQQPKKEVTDPKKGAKLWPRFTRVIGADKASRELFDLIVGDPKNLELLEKATEKPESAGKLYQSRREELYKASHIPIGPGSSRIVYAPLADALAWMYLGTFPGAESSLSQSYSLDFLPMMPPGRTARDEWRDALKDKEASAPLRRLIGKWTAARADTTGREFGLQIGTAYDIAEVLPAARETITTKVKDAAYPGNIARNVGIAMLAVGKLGTKVDLPLLEKYAKDETQCAVFLHDRPSKPGEPVLRLPRHPIEGQDTTTQLRDVSAAMRLHLLGQNPNEFGFYWSWPYGEDKGKPNALGTFYLNAIGFSRNKDREAAHKKAKEWFEKKDEPDPAAKLVEQLGAAEFAAREAAEERLTDLGIKAKPAVLAGLKSENPEIVRRCKAVLTHIRGEEVKAAFLKAAGDDDAARTLLAEVLKDVHRAKVLDEAVQYPERSGKLYAAEQWRLWQKAVSTPPGATEADIPTAPEIALSFMLGSHPSSANALKTEAPPDDPRISEGRRAAESDLLCKSLQLELFDPKRKPPFARLMAGWLAARSDPWVVSLGLGHARQYRLPEVVPVARNVARNAKLDAQHRANATLALADLGGPAELSTLRTLTDDKTEWSHFKEGRDPNGPTFTVELRDVAVGAALLLSDQNPGEFGFPEFNRQGAAALKLHEKLSGRMFAFVSEADRAAAHKKAKEWFDKKDDPDQAAKLVEQLGAAKFADREAAQQELRKLGMKADMAIKSGQKSENPEIVKRCTELLDAIRNDLLGGKDSPVWRKFKTVAGDDADAWKLYLRVIGTRRRGEMLLAAIADPKKAATSFATECDEIGKIMDRGRAAGVALPPKPPGFPDRDVTTDDLAALLFLGTLAPATENGVKRELSAVTNHVLISGLGGESKAAFGKLYAGWAEPRWWAWDAAFNIALTEQVAALTPLARKALKSFAAKERVPSAKEAPFALRLLGWYGTTDDIPLLLKFADDKTKCGSMSGGGKEDGTIVQVRDLAVIAALTLRKQRPQDHGFAMHDIAPPWPANFLANHGFYSDADRVAAHKKARAWLDKQNTVAPKKD